MTFQKFRFIFIFSRRNLGIGSEDAIGRRRISRTPKHLTQDWSGRNEKARSAARAFFVLFLCRAVFARVVRILLRGDAISTHFLAKIAILIKVYTTKYWKPKSRSPPPVFIPRPRRLDFIYRGTHDGRSLKKQLQPLRRLTPKFVFFRPFAFVRRQPSWGVLCLGNYG